MNMLWKSSRFRPALPIELTVSLGSHSRWNEFSVYLSVSRKHYLPSCSQCSYTLKNKAASRCHRRTFLSKWLNKEALTSEEPLFHKSFLVVKEGSSDYKKVRKRYSLTEWFFVEPEMVPLWHRLKNLLKHLYF